MSMPHVCGDEPEWPGYHRKQATVCPTYVGMNRTHLELLESESCMPHVCGDEPALDRYGAALDKYAPRMWG